MSLTAVKNRPRPSEHVLPLLQRFTPIPKAEWKHAETLLRFRELAAGDALTEAGNVADRLAFVVRGLLRKLHVTARGKPIVRDFAGPGSIAGAYVSLLTGKPSYLRVEALEATALFVLEWKELDALYERHACWQTLGRKLAESFVIERETRAHELLTLSASERYASFCATHRDFVPRLRAYDIASYLGITPVALSRLRAREHETRRHRTKI
jgi:CRP-like cAMP-binding protein